ncbi:hypothetical protein CTA2_7691 [Colletotrichum tanaceti]|uniref:Uncharacterized protein n=1 Tax=Colletotrichum tanaceti TaxID=1306861 RepID=A0A4U6XUJ6_9PEZI|nr:hypothetical protein CTA2_7691 [Colletotrichum tanaceti]TKW59591.1 hypothetical protein CTA1_7839 [Colletotrichum tanaceti]
MEGGWPSITTEILKRFWQNERGPIPFTPTTLHTTASRRQRCTLSSLVLFCGLGHSKPGPTLGGRDKSVFLLDTKLGIVYWPECPGKIMHNPSREPIWDGPYEWAPENEADWRVTMPLLEPARTSLGSSRINSSH